MSDRYFQPKCNGQVGGEVLVEATGLRLAHSGGRGGGQDKWPIHRGKQSATGRGALAK